MNIAAFDLETNGYPGTSVLSASSIVFDEAGHLLAFFNRFYLPTETFNRWLVRVHGLTLERLLALRARRSDGSPYFVEDWPDLMAFWDHWNVRGLVIHNARFDMAFLPEAAQLLLPCWCSMRGLTEFCALPGRNRFKPPRLSVEESMEWVFERLKAYQNIEEEKRESVRGYLEDMTPTSTSPRTPWT